MNKSNISVVIPYYNDSLNFERTLQSVCNQTLQPLEVIIIDDASHDSLRLIEIIENYRGKFSLDIRYYRNEVNMNGAYSRNFGIKKSVGDYIALLDGDDYWKDTHLEKSFDFLIKNKIGFLYSNIIYVDENNIIKNKKVTDYNVLKNINDILFYSPPQTNSFFFKKDIFILENIWFNEKLKRHQDWQFLIKIFESNVKIGYLNEYTSYYCYSHRPQLSRVNYDSVFYFWSENQTKFTKCKFEKFIRKTILDACSIIDFEVFNKKYESITIYSNAIGNKFFLNLINKKYIKNNKLRKILYYLFFDINFIYRKLKGM